MDIVKCLKERYAYLSNGDLIYINDSGAYGRIKAGTVAGSINSQGVKMVYAYGRKAVQAHQAVWAIVNGEWPTRVIRHIDGNKMNNRVENLMMDSQPRVAPQGPITVGRLREMLNYDSETGVLTWRESPRNRTLPGDVAGRVNDSGYVLLTLDKKTIRAHRAAWAIYYGELPCRELDHINGKRSDNRIVNLREVTRSQNCQNSFTRKNNSGVKGVHLRKDTGRYSAQIQVDGEVTYLGCFDNIEAAKNARVSAEKSKHSHRKLA